MLREHMGKIIKEAINKSGKTITQVAIDLGISRNTLYSKFKLPYVRKDFIIKLGYVLKHDFSNDITNFGEYSKIFESIWGEIDDRKEMKFAKPYLVLLEEYNKLLMLLIRISNIKNLECIREEIGTFLKDNEYL